MKQPWRLFDEFRPATEPGGDRDATRWVRDTVARLGVADPVTGRLVHDLAEAALAGASASGEVPLSVSYRVFVPADSNTTGDAIQHWAFFLVTRPKCRSDPDKEEGPCVIQVFLYPAVPGDPNAEARPGNTRARRRV